MPRHDIVYPKHMTVTDEGKALYAIWRRAKQNTDPNGPFADYPTFFNWAMDHKYVLGARLRRHIHSQPYSPDNCTFEAADPEYRNVSPELKQTVNDWNRTVNVFRKACGLPLFDVEA